MFIIYRNNYQPIILIQSQIYFCMLEIFEQTLKTSFEYKIPFYICVLLMCIHKGYFVVKSYREMFILKLSGIQKCFYLSILFEYIDLLNFSLEEATLG